MWGLLLPSPLPSCSFPASTVLLTALTYRAQLVRFDFEALSYFVPNGPWAISDTPRFPWRGLMLDTARHFQPLASIKSLVDSLPYAKINVLHWHMVAGAPASTRPSPALRNLFFYLHLHPLTHLLPCTAPHEAYLRYARWTRSPSRCSPRRTPSCGRAPSHRGSVISKVTCLPEHEVSRPQTFSPRQSPG